MIRSAQVLDSTSCLPRPSQVVHSCIDPTTTACFFGPFHLHLSPARAPRRRQRCESEYLEGWIPELEWSHRTFRFDHILHSPGLIDRWKHPLQAIQDHSCHNHIAHRSLRGIKKMWSRRRFWRSAHPVRFQSFEALELCSSPFLIQVQMSLMKNQGQATHIGSYPIRILIHFCIGTMNESHRTQSGWQSGLEG